MKKYCMEGYTQLGFKIYIDASSKQAALNKLHKMTVGDLIKKASTVDTENEIIIVDEDNSFDCYEVELIGNKYYQK